MEEQKITVETISKKRCLKCKAPLSAVIGDRSVLVICLNHKKASNYKLVGDGTCDYSFVQDRKSFYERK